MTTIRKFVTVAGASSNARLCTEDSDAAEVYVAELVAGAGIRSLDEDDCEVGSSDDRDWNRDVIVDLCVPLFCCRGKGRKLPPRTPEEALRQSAAKGKEGLQPGCVVNLNGRAITL